MRWTIAIGALLLMTTNTLAGDTVYVSVAPESRIAIFDQLEDGGLKHRADVKVEGAPGALAVDAAKKFLFAALRTTEKIASFRRTSDGGLELIGVVPAGFNFAHLLPDPSGKWLVCASYSSGCVSVRAINSDGSLAAEPTHVVKTAPSAHCVTFDASGKFVYVPHVTTNNVRQFRLTDAGKLEDLDPPAVEGAKNGYDGKNAGPRHIKFHPKLNVGYTSDESGCSVSMWRLDRASGRLTLEQTVSSLPADYKGTALSTAEVKIHPNGKFVYISNRGHDSLAGFAIDQETGRVTSIGQFPTEKTPRSFEISTDGRFFYGAGEGNGKLSAYRCDAATGKLEKFATYELGSPLVWVLAL